MDKACHCLGCLTARALANVAQRHARAIDLDDAINTDSDAEPLDRRSTAGVKLGTANDSDADSPA